MQFTEFYSNIRSQHLYHDSNIISGKVILILLSKYGYTQFNPIFPTLPCATLSVSLSVRYVKAYRKTQTQRLCIHYIVICSYLINVSSTWAKSEVWDSTLSLTEVKDRWRRSFLHRSLQSQSANTEYDSDWEIRQQTEALSKHPWGEPWDSAAANVQQLSSVQLIKHFSFVIFRQCFGLWT